MRRLARKRGPRAYLTGYSDRKSSGSGASGCRHGGSRLYSRSDSRMVPNWRRLGTVFCALMAFGLLATFAAEAQAGDFYADLDRDGVRDVVSIQPSSGLVVWLSGTKSLLNLPTRRPIMRVTAADIDGDGRIELVASDTAARLHVWHGT